MTNRSPVSGHLTSKEAWSPSLTSSIWGVRKCEREREKWRETARERKREKKEREREESKCSENNKKHQKV